MTLMAGPIDTRVNPSKVNELAKKRSIDWFERTLTASVPLRYPGAFRRVYPGFVQLAAFMSMNIDRHVKAHRELYENLANGEVEKAAMTKAFYDEYLAVLDLTAEFYLETVRLIFQEHALPLGKLTWHGNSVDPSAIRRTMLFTVEGERDDICSVGQTVAAHDLCSKLRPYLKRHHMQAGVGHYGVFSGKRWENQVYPILQERDFVERLRGVCWNLRKLRNSRERRIFYSIKRNYGHERDSAGIRIHQEFWPLQNAGAARGRRRLKSRPDRGLFCRRARVRGIAAAERQAAKLRHG